MGLTLLETATILVAGMMAGNELCVSFVNSVLRRQEGITHFHSARALAAFFGAIMPFWYASTLLLAGGVAFRLRAAGNQAVLADLAAGIYLLSIVYTVIGLVPINNRIAKWEWETRPADWKQVHQKWDTRHGLRVAMLTLALACLALACLTART